MESWLDVQPLRIPRPKLLSSVHESGSDIRTIDTSSMMKNTNYETKCDSVGKKIPVATK